MTWILLDVMMEPVKWFWAVFLHSSSSFVPHHISDGYELEADKVEGLFASRWLYCQALGQRIAGACQSPSSGGGKTGERYSDCFCHLIQSAMSCLFEILKFSERELAVAFTEVRSNPGADLFSLNSAYLAYPESSETQLLCPSRKYIIDSSKCKQEGLQARTVWVGYTRTEISKPSLTTSLKIVFFMFWFVLWLRIYGGKEVITFFSPLFFKQGACCWLLFIIFWKLLRKSTEIKC